MHTYMSGTFLILIQPVDEPVLSYESENGNEIHFYLMLKVTKTKNKILFALVTSFKNVAEIFALI